MAKVMAPAAHIICIALYCCMALAGCQGRHSDKAAAVTNSLVGEEPLHSIKAAPGTEHADTVFRNVSIDGANFDIKVLRDQYPILGGTKATGGFYPITIKVMKANDTAVLFSKNYNQNEYTFFTTSTGHAGQQTTAYINLANYGYGSGYAVTLYQFSYHQRHFTIDSILAYGELSYLAFSNNGNELILLNGIWGHESHFDCHRFKILRYLRTGQGYKEINVGTTKFNYPSPTDSTINKVLPMIKLKEPVLMNAINPTSYQLSADSVFWRPRN